MNGTLRCIVTFGLFLGLPYFLRLILTSDITRRRYALVASLLLGFVFFLLSIMYVDDNSYQVGIVVFIPAIIGGYLTNYLLYPVLKKLNVIKPSSK